MANLHITEFDRLVSPADAGGQAPALKLPYLANKPVAIGAESTKSEAMGNGTTMVRLRAEAACHIAVGKDPTATVNSMPLGAGQTESFGISAGDKIAVIQAAG